MTSPGNTTEAAAALMVDKAYHWYYAERDICGRATATEPPCVKSVGHDGDCDGTYQPSWEERFSEWLDHQRVLNRAEMAREQAESGNCAFVGHSEAFMAGMCDCGLAPE